MPVIVYVRQVTHETGEDTVKSQPLLPMMRTITNDQEQKGQLQPSPSNLLVSEPLSVGNSRMSSAAAGHFAQPKTLAFVSEGCGSNLIRGCSGVGGLRSFSSAPITLLGNHDADDATATAQRPIPVFQRRQRSSPNLVGPPGSRHSGDRHCSLEPCNSHQMAVPLIRVVAEDEKERNRERESSCNLSSLAHDLEDPCTWWVQHGNEIILSNDL